jgi:hypothetical protein
MSCWIQGEGVSRKNLIRQILCFGMAVVLIVAVTPSAIAETELIQGQIISTNTTWGTPGKDLKIDGLIQIRTGVTLTINPGASLDVSNGSFLVLGSLSIVGNSTSQKPAVFARSWLSGSGNVSMSGLNISGSGGALFPYEVTGSISMIDSTISKFDSIFGQTQSSFLVFNGNTVLRVSNFYANPGFFTSYSVTITNNSFYDVQKISGEWPGIYVRLGQALPSFVFTGNYFENSSTTLSLEPRSVESYPNLKASNNYFATPTKVTLVANGIEFSQNYWTGITSENELRSQVKVIDGITNITLPIIKFAPLLSSPPAAQQSLTRLRALLDAEVSAKAAAELKAKQEAEAKAASELKAKQEAEAKAAADVRAKQDADAKAAAERVAAELKAKQEVSAKEAATKRTTIVCIKGKLTKKVTAVKPVCPAGYRKK